MQRWVRWFFLSSMVLCWGAEAQSGELQEGIKTFLPMQECQGEARNLDVTAEHLTFDRQTRTFTFEKNVRVRRCQMILLCDRLDVTNDVKGETVERLVATGNVRLQQRERRVQADRAEYFEAEQKLVLTGNPRAWSAQNRHELSGDEIVVFLNREKIAVKRARVVFHPQPQSSPDVPGR